MLFSKKPAVLTGDAQIAELVTRGVERVFPGEDFLRAALKSGKRQTLYLGIDPTGPTLHMGHLIPLLKLRQFQELGHKIILLIGDFTAQIGDPTDKNSTRKRLTSEEVYANQLEYQKQASRVISFVKKENPATLQYNSKWLAKMNLVDIINLAANLTHSQMIKRDMFQQRIAEGKDLYLHEFLYPLMQGYDSVAMDVDGEVGGNDQTFNMLVGRDLIKKLKGKEKFVIAMKLLADPAGKKMGKTEGNMVSFRDTSADCFGKIMSWPDSMIIPGFELCTIVPQRELESVQKQLEGGVNPKELKLRLAEAVVSLLHGESEAKKARASFDAAFTKGKPETFIGIAHGRDATTDELIAAKVVASKSELRRLIAEGAVTNLDTGEKVSEDFLRSAPKGKYRLGKHRFIEIK